MVRKVNLSERLFFSCFIPAILILFLLLAWFVSEPVRAAKIDTYTIYFADDVLRFCYLKASLYNPLAIFNPFAKFLWVIIARIFYSIFPIGILAPRLMNSFFSIGIIAITYKLAKKIGLSPKDSFLTVALLLSFPLYVVASFSTLSEIMFCFFLMLAIYLFLNEKYLPAVIFASFLPLIRQEGIIYFLIWVPFIYRKKRRYLPLFFAPVFFFILADILIANHAPWFFFLYNFIVAEIPSSESYLPLEGKINVLIYLACQPLLFFAAIEAFKQLKYKKHILLAWCFLLSFIYSITWHGFFYLVSKSLLREFRFMIYLFPLASILASIFLVEFKNKFRIFSKNISALLLFFLFLFLSIQQHYQLQKMSQISGKIVSREEDCEIKMVSDWLDGYFRQSGNYNMYVFGDRVTHKFIRRLWLYLKSPVKYYAVIRGGKLLDVVTFQIMKEYDFCGVAVVLGDNEGDGELIKRINGRLIRSFPFTKINIYKVSQDG